MSREDAKAPTDFTLFREKVGTVRGRLLRAKPQDINKDLVEENKAEVQAINLQAQAFKEVDASDIDQRIIEERAKAIAKICRDIQEINTIMKTLAELVHDQGQMLDTIEANVETVHSNIRKAVRELAKARKYQNQNTFKRFFATTGLIVVSAFYVSSMFSVSLTSPPMIVLGVGVGVLALYNLYLRVISRPDPDVEQILKDTDPGFFSRRAREEKVIPAGIGLGM